MSALKYTALQVCIICILGFLLGIRLLVQYPVFFNGEEHNDRPGIGRTEASGRFITIGSATSTEDSGFFDHVLPIFHAATGLDVHVDAIGSGRALARGTRGDVDVLLVHDPVGEENFVANGYGVDRRNVMYNDFVIVGPRSDPAGIRGEKDAAVAFAKIASGGALFASRGDDGGTHQMELRLWKLAGVAPAGHSWYRDMNEGIGATLNFAATLDAYALTDRATWANLKNKQNLEILSEGDPALFNPYGSVLVSPAKLTETKFNDAKTWHVWLTSRAGIDAITSYRIAGEELFFPPRPRL